MTTKIVYLPKAAQISKALFETVATLCMKIMSPDGDTLSPSDIIPLVDVVHDLAKLQGNAETMAVSFENRLAALEVSHATGVPKPASDFASQLDQRLAATSELLRATLERLDQVEAAVVRLYKTPFLPIDPHDHPRKKLASLRAKFDVACPNPIEPVA